mmetsp:Transcript_78061/g.242023  ORF Transcript_78061/g.242023 Transcript_78061/m.242023 type:complete len:241 (-) Transcript_78061:284-1006(-)
MEVLRGDGQKPAQGRHDDGAGAAPDRVHQGHLLHPHTVREVGHRTVRVGAEHHQAPLQYVVGRDGGVPLLAEHRLGGHDLLADDQGELLHEVLVPHAYLQDQAQGHQMGHPELLADRAAELVRQVFGHEALEVPLHLLRRSRLVQAVHHRDLRLDAHLMLPEEAHSGIPDEGQMDVLLEHGQGLDNAPAANKHREQNALRGYAQLQHPDTCVHLLVAHLPDGDRVVGPPEAPVVVVERHV